MILRKNEPMRQVEETGLELACEDFRVREALPQFLQSLERTVNVTLVGGTQEGDNVLYMFLLNVLTPLEPNIFDARNALSIGASLTEPVK